jgi:hypothetical protein
VDVLDLIVVATALSAAVGGWRLGLLARATSWIGLAAGLVLAAGALLLALYATLLEPYRPVLRRVEVRPVISGGAA